MRTYIYGGNWKMNLDKDSVKSLLEDLLPKVNDVKDREIVVFPPYVYLSLAVDIVKGSNIQVGAQNVFYEDNGAYTGEISTSMLEDIGCSYVIIGHSERRHIIGETDKILNKKIKKALESKLNIIFCVGELLEEREANKTEQVVLNQIRNGLEGIEEKYLSRIVIAYEPVWAIGTGKVATPEDAQAVHKIIREEIKQLYNDNIANNLRIQYGGSVKPNNIEGLIAQPDIDGGLIGGASLKADSFAAIIKA